MHYVISDIHGEYEKYLKMLELISFSDDDVLYVLGDMADRHPGGVNVIKHVKSLKNAVAILGNHELMMTQVLGIHNSPFAGGLWSQNGGDVTKYELQFECSKEERRDILEWAETLPEFIDVRVGETDFHLVHGWCGNDTNERVWPGPRPKWHSISPLKDKTMIIGHTPIPLLYGHVREYMSKLESKEEHIKIFHGNGFYDIDCGCAMDHPLRRLACLRLEDMQEFYM